jgi:hypothetical protein
MPNYYFQEIFITPIYVGEAVIIPTAESALSNLQKYENKIFNEKQNFYLSMPYADLDSRIGLHCG